MGEEEEAGSKSSSVMMFYYQREQSYGSVVIKGDLGQGRLCIFKVRDATACLMRGMSQKRGKF